MSKFIKSLYSNSLLVILSFVIMTTFSLPAFSSDMIPKQVIDYLNKMKSAKGNFTQIGPDGVITQGKFALRKPGKIYFNYDPPTPLKIVSDGFWVSVEDVKLKTRDRYPLSETPLSILLSDTVDFKQSDYKISNSENDNSYFVTAYDPKHQERGQITIAFSKQPTILMHWVVTDAQGLKTIVNLHDIDLNVPTKNDLYFIPTDNGKTGNQR